VRFKVWQPSLIFLIQYTMLQPFFSREPKIFNVSVEIVGFTGFFAKTQKHNFSLDTSITNQKKTKIKKDNIDNGDDIDSEDNIDNSDNNKTMLILKKLESGNAEILLCYCELSFL
jgi:hypothetical protein